MTVFHGPRRRPARPNPNAQPKASYVPDILAAWAELHRAIDARKRGNDRLSTIEAVWQHQAEEQETSRASEIEPLRRQIVDYERRMESARLAEQSIEREAAKQSTAWENCKKRHGQR